MRNIRISDDLTIRIDDDVICLSSTALERDREAAGVVIIYPEELDGLIAALMEAARVIRSQGGEQCYYSQWILDTER